MGLHNEKTEDGVKIHVERFVISPSRNKEVLKSDIGIILLVQAMTINQYVSPICIGRLDAVRPRPAEKLLTVGWGRTDL